MSVTATQLHAASILVAAAGFPLLFALTEQLHRRGIPVEITRRVAHMVGCAEAAVVQALLTLPELAVLAAGFAAFLVGTQLMGRLGSIHAVRRENPRGLSSGLLICSSRLSWERIASAFGILVLGFCDPLAAIVGRFASFSWRVPGGRKSLPGSASFFATALSLAGIFAFGAGSISLPAVLATAAALTAIEACGYRECGVGSQPTTMRPSI